MNDRCSGSFSEHLPEFCQAISRQEALLDYVASLLPSGPQQDAALSKLSRIKLPFDVAISETSELLSGRPPRSNDVDRSPGYLGDVSDVGFRHLIEQFLTCQGGTSMVQTDLESYSQRDSVQLPTLGEAKEYINAYFSTLHIAYPFVPESLFMRDYPRLRDQADADTRATNHVEKALSCKC